MGATSCGVGVPCGSRAGPRRMPRDGGRFRAGPAYGHGRLRKVIRSCRLTAGECRARGYRRAVTSNAAPRGRHRLAERARPAVLPRSLNVVAVTVGAVVALASPGRYAEYRNAHPHADGPTSTSVSALEPVIPIPAPRRPADRLTVPPVTGDALAAAHPGPTVRAVDAVHAAAVSAVVAAQRTEEPLPPVAA